eukprot:370844-Amphidinium_carterae.1
MNGDVFEVVAAMARHRESSVLQTWASGALGGIASKHTSNQSMVTACGGLDSIAAAMQGFPEDGDLQAHTESPLCYELCEDHC